MKTPFYPDIIFEMQNFSKSGHFKNEIKLKEITSLLEKIRVTQAFWKAKRLKSLSWLFWVLDLVSWLKKLKTVVIIYADIPNWGQSTVVGHAGKHLLELCLDVKFWLFKGVSILWKIAWSRCSVRVMKALGCEEGYCNQCSRWYRFGPEYFDGHHWPHVAWLVKPIDRWKLGWFWSTFPDMSKAYLNP